MKDILNLKVYPFLWTVRRQKGPLRHKKGPVRKNGRILGKIYIIYIERKGYEEKVKILGGENWKISYKMN